MTDTTDHLIQSLIDSNKSLSAAVNGTNTNVEKLTESVNKLVNIDAKREEREKIQVEKNHKYDSFIEENRYPINRMKQFFITWDKVKIPVFAALLFAVLLAMGIKIK